jgi:hypothetical protein
MTLALALIGFVAAAGVMQDNSLLTHVATGRLILDTGAVPDVDPYSRFGAGQPWTVQSWLVSVVYALLDRGLGPAGIRAFHGLLGAAIGAGVWRLTRPAGRLVSRTVLAVGPVLVGVGLWSPRPLLVGLAALVGMLILLRSDRPVWLAVPLLWVWANAHGSFPLGPGLLLLVALGHRLDRRTPPPRLVALLAWSVVGTLLAAVGPIGLRLLAFPLEVVASRDAMVGVVEWEAPTFGSAGELVWLALTPLPVLAARRGGRWADLVPAVAFTVAAALALRNVAPAAIAVVALTAPALGGRYRERAASGSDGGDGPRHRLAARAVAAASVTALAVGLAAVLAAPGLDLDNYPVDEVDRLEEFGLVPAADVVVAHREAVGNYLTWRFGAGASVFVDDRFDFHDPQLLADHRDLLAARDARRILDRRGADVVLWQADDPLVQWLAEAPEWSVTVGEEWAVACRLDAEVAGRCRSASGPTDPSAAP